MIYQRSFPLNDAALASLKSYSTLQPGQDNWPLNEVWEETQIFPRKENLVSNASC